MNTRQRLLERPGRWRLRLPRWLLPTALLALVPKCVLCVLAYAGIGALGWGGPELCGASPASDVDWARSVPLIAAVAGGAGWLMHRRRRARPGGQDFGGFTAMSSTSKIRPEPAGMSPTPLLP